LDILFTVNVLEVIVSDVISFWFTILIEFILVTFNVLRFNNPEVIVIEFTVSVLII
jgi:hypothetical protein